MKSVCIVSKITGWNTVEDICRKLNIKRSTAYVYLSKLNRSNFIVQKVKRPRGTMYLISSTPVPYKHFGMYEKTDLVSHEIEMTKKEVTPEQKIAFFLSQYKAEKNVRYFEEARKNMRKIKNWKRMYKFIKAYKVENEFRKLYINARKVMKKVPRIPKRYEKLLMIKC
jgi:predicted RND superfamily exporter protein